MSRKPAKKATKRVGRPSSYTEALADKILRAIVDGKSLREICKAEGMPDRMTVIHWQDTVEGFAAKYTRAREGQADTMDDLILETAGKTNARNAAAMRVRIDAYKWRAEKLKSKVYGARQTIEHDVSDNLAVKLKAARERAGIG